MWLWILPPRLLHLGVSPWIQCLALGDCTLQNVSQEVRTQSQFFHLGVRPPPCLWVWERCPLWEQWGLQPPPTCVDVRAASLSLIHVFKNENSY